MRWQFVWWWTRWSIRAYGWPSTWPYRWSLHLGPLEIRRWRKPYPNIDEEAVAPTGRADSQTAKLLQPEGSNRRRSV